MHMCAGGGGVQRRPEFAVQRVDIRAELDQQSRHLLRVVDTALSARTQYALRLLAPLKLYNRPLKTAIWPCNSEVWCT